VIPENLIASVCIITYNQKAFIGQTIKSTLNQKTDFYFEILISDDCSTDGTLDVCIEYQNRYPNSIRVLKNDVNQGMNKNLMKAIANCKGKYIAICEGDDYWCDENKLQKQVDFLEANPDYAICFHPVYEIKDKDLQLSYLNKSTKEESYTIKDLAKENFIHTPSVVFCNSLFKEFPKWFHLSPIGDYVLHMLNAQHGLIKYFPEPMAVYRRHAGSIWSRLNSALRFEKWLIMLNYLIEENFEQEVKQHLIKQKRKCIEKYLKLLMNEANWQVFLEKLALFSKEDEYISQKWLLEYYPQYIASFTSSRSYRYTKSLRNIINKITRKIVL